MIFEYKNDTQNGILRYLYNTTKNYEEEVLTSATSEIRTHESNLSVDFNSTSYWHATDYSPIGEYIVVYFPNYFLKLSGYSITTSFYQPAYDVTHPKNWGFDASNDNKTWNNQINISDPTKMMNKAFASIFIPWSFGIYKYYRIMMTGEQHDQMKKNQCDIAQIEFFGELLRNLPNTKQCINYHT